MNATTQLSGVSSPFSLRDTGLLLKDIAILSLKLPFRFGPESRPGEYVLLRDVRPIGETSVALKQSLSSHSGLLGSTFLFIDPRSDVEWTIFELDAVCLTLG
jgi:hypothetical protein